MAQAARALWPGGRASAWRLGCRPPPGLPAQSRAGFAGAAGGPGPAATARKGSPRVLGAAALALGGALGLYHTARWHLRTQDLRAECSAAQVSPGRTRTREGEPGSALNLRTYGNSGVRNCPLRLLLTLGE